jgi:PadR family transcriptional regulator, regulatory protein AphA
LVIYFAASLEMSMPPRTRPSGEMPAEHAILGLLSIEEGSGHGYDLARNFSDGQPLAAVLRLEPGMLYHHLKKMEKAGWVTSAVVPQPSRPPRHVYQITESGRQELDRWLKEPVTHTREIRLEFLVKLYFARLFDPVLAARLVSEQLGTLQHLETGLLEQTGERDPFVRQVYDLRLAQTRAAIDWIKRLG